MINVSSAWHRTLYNDNRNYLERITVTLADNTVINLTNENIWGGAKFDDAVSSDNDFQIGSAIVNKLVFNINNIYEDYSEYDFTDAKVVAKIGLVTDVNTEIVKKGTYIVNTATYNGSLINLECYDYMCKFEKLYSNCKLVYPASLDTIIRRACADCGVSLQTLDFPHKNYVISERPSDDNATYREVISWCAQIAGCFARCNTDGKLEIKWFDQASIGDGSYGLNGGIFDDGSPRYASGDTADGGNFNPWNTGYEHDSGEFSTPINVHYISSLYSKNISVDDVVITGVRILIKEDNHKNIEPILVGTSGYVIEISNNPFILSTAIATEIATWLGTQLIGFKFRKAQITHGSDPSIEAGDVALVIDGKGSIYPIVISHTVFTVGSAQTTTSSAQTPARNSAQRYSNETKNYIELRKAIINEHTAREEAELELAQAIANAGGLYETTIVDSETGATTYYLHNKTELNESDIRLMFSDVGITVTADGGQHWYGLTASGDMIAHLLSTTGINADWINTGQLVVRDADDNETFFVDTATGIVRINASAFKLQGSTISSIANSVAGDAISSYDSNLDQQKVFDKLTNDGETQGILLEDNKIYINMTYARTGTLIIDGSTTGTDGIIEIINNYHNRVGRIDRTGIYFGNISSNLNSPYFRLYDNGVIESRFGSSSHYARMGSTYGFEVQGNNINVKLYASDWTYQRDDTHDPDAEVPDPGPDDPDRTPGFFGYNTGLKITDTEGTNKAYTAIGKNYVETSYNAKEGVEKSFAQLRSTSSHQILELAYKANDLDREKSIILTENGFSSIRDGWNEYRPYTGSLTIDGTTYYLRGGIICEKTL